MTWRGSTIVSDRIFACLPYLLPLLEGIALGSFLFAQFPLLNIVFLPVLLLSGIYKSIPFAGIIVFFALFLLVVRNEKISHFIRFNTMQAILINIVIFLCVFVLQSVPVVPGTIFAIQTLASILFIGIVAAVVYSVIQSLSGRYAEIPSLSEAVYMQVR
jgi:uncharacterized membrane protein